MIDFSVILHQSCAFLHKIGQKSEVGRIAQFITLVLNQSLICTNTLKKLKKCLLNSMRGIAGLARKKKTGAWSPLTFFYPRRVVSYR